MAIYRIRLPHEQNQGGYNPCVQCHLEPVKWYPAVMFTEDVHQTKTCLLCSTVMKTAPNTKLYKIKDSAMMEELVYEFHTSLYTK